MITETILYANSITLKGTQLFSFSFFSVSVELIIGRVCRCSCVHILLLFFRKIKVQWFSISRYYYPLPIRNASNVNSFFGAQYMLHRLNES